MSASYIIKISINFRIQQVNQRIYQALSYLTFEFRKLTLNVKFNGVLEYETFSI